MIEMHSLTQLMAFLLCSSTFNFSKDVSALSDFSHLVAAPCPTGYFPCNSSSVCVEQRMNCDSKADCPDNSDEWSCEDKIRKNFYDSLFKKRPDADREHNTSRCELRSAPEECRCSKTSLFCENKNLQKIPQLLPQNTHELDLSGNRLHKIQRSDFPELRNLATLILRSSEVTLLESEALGNLMYLQKLYLINNHISTISNRTFWSNTNLRLITLSHNPLYQLNPGAFQGLFNLEELDLRDCKLQTLPSSVFDDLKKLEVLWLDGNGMEILPMDLFRNLGKLKLLSISRNSLTRIRTYAFEGLVVLKSLSLSSNRIWSLEEDSFGNLSSLIKLDLHRNALRSIERKIFSKVTKLESLNLMKNPLKALRYGTFDDLIQLKYIYFDDFHLCSLALHVRVCEPRGDGISSIAHLLDSVVLRVSVWLVAVVAGLGNVAVLVGRFLFAEPNEVHSFYIKNLSLADLLMALYLFAIAAYDLVFRGEYIRHEERWRRSWQCNLCGFLSTLSSESSILILAVITTDRYMSILHPLSVKKRTLQSAAVAMGLAWGVAALFSALPLLDIDYYGDEFYGNNGVCLPLHIHDPFGQAWEYSTFLFCGLNFATFLLILFAYISMFFTISHSKIGLRCTQQQQDRNIAKRFFFIVATDFLCWVPIVFIKLISMSGVPIQEDLYAWVAVFLLPVNSAINPILYTLTTKLFKQHLAMMVYNFKASSGDSVAPSCARHHSLRSQKSSFSQADQNTMALVTRNCPACRKPPLFGRQRSTGDFGGCRRHSSKRTSTSNVL